MRPRSHSLSKENKRTKGLFKVCHRDLAPRNSFGVTLLQAYFADPQAPPPVCAWGSVQTSPWVILTHFLSGGREKRKKSGDFSASCRLRVLNFSSLFCIIEDIREKGRFFHPHGGRRPMAVAGKDGP